MSEKKETLLSIGAGVSQEPLIVCAREKGYTVIAIDRSDAAPGFAHATRRIIMSTHDTRAVVETLRNLVNEYQFVGVVARSGGQALYSAAAIAEAFGLPGLLPELVTLATEKSSLRHWCEAHDVEAPRGLRLSSGEGLDTLDFSYPVVIKPDMTIDGKVGVSRVDTAQTARGAYAAAERASENKLVEVEEYISGMDVSCVFIIKKGTARVITYWDELVGETDGAVHGIGVSVPTQASSLAQAQMAEVASKIATVFPTATALLIASFRVEAKVWLIELHADLGGDGIAEVLLPHAAPQFDYFGLAIDVACGKDVSAHVEYIPTIMRGGIVI